jgi:hypothetical protein
MGIAALGGIPGIRKSWIRKSLRLQAVKELGQLEFPSFISVACLFSARVLPLYLFCEGRKGGLSQ